MESCPIITDNWDLIYLRKSIMTNTYFHIVLILMIIHRNKLIEKTIFYIFTKISRL